MQQSIKDTWFLSAHAPLCIRTGQQQQQKKIKRRSLNTGRQVCVEYYVSSIIVIITLALSLPLSLSISLFRPQFRALLCVCVCVQKLL